MTVTIPEPVIDPKRFLLDEVNTEAGPIFSVSEMAQFFFARTNHWVRMLESKHLMRIADPDAPDGWRPVGTRRRGEGQNAARIYTLTDIEEIAHALAENGSISGSQLRLTLMLIKVQAQMHQYL